jgi:hypothetical protein
MAQTMNHLVMARTRVESAKKDIQMLETAQVAHAHSRDRELESTTRVKGPKTSVKRERRRRFH